MTADADLNATATWAVARYPDQKPLITQVLRGGVYVGAARRPGLTHSGPRVPGALVRDLVLGSEGDGRRAAVRLKAVDIDGDVDLSCADWRGVLVLEDCRVRGIVDLSYSDIRGRVSLKGSHLQQLDAQYADIRGPLVFSDGFARRGVFALGVTISGSLDLRNTELRAPVEFENRCALELFRAKLADLFLQETWLVGGLYGPGMTVERNVRLQGVVATSRKSMGLKVGADTADGQAVTMVGSNIGAALYLSSSRAAVPAPVFVGALVLTRVSCVTLRVRPAHLRKVQLQLEGLTFRRLSSMKVRQWLAVIDRAKPPSNQPYTFLASYCESHQLSSARRDTLIAMQQRATDAQPWRSPARWSRELWHVTVAYGYRPARALLWLAVVVGLCGLLLWQGSDFLLRAATEKVPAQRGLHGFEEIGSVALDSILPFAGLGAADDWAGHPENAVQFMALVGFVALKFTAWGLAALGLASLTGIGKSE